jgi:lactose/cellobiose-specific phosphotransferase system IIC component
MKSREGITEKKPRGLFSLSDQPLLRGVRQGFMYMVPMLIIGAIIVAILNLPIAGYQNFMVLHFGGNWKDFLLVIHQATLQIISLTAVICISYSISSDEKPVQDGLLRPIYPVITAFACYVVYLKPGEIIDAVITAKAAGASSMFTAMLISIISVKLLSWLFTKYDNRFPETKYALSGNATILSSFHAILPVFATIFIFGLVNMLLHFTGLSVWMDSGLTSIFGYLFMQDSIISVILIVLITQILWFFGIHGGNVFMEALGSAQDTALAQGIEISHFSKEFFDIFVYFGGAGSTFALVAVLLFFGEANSDRKLARVSLVPSLLNINEPLIYGLPIVLSTYYFIPFILAPLASSVIAYTAMNAGLVPVPVADIPWTTPIFVSGYLSTGSLSAVLLQFVCFAAAFFIYLPFARIKRRDARARYKENYKNLAGEISYLQSVKVNKVMNRSDEVGSVARYLARQLGATIKNDAGDLHMEFQPKVVKDGRVSGAEALLRWTHPGLGGISPMVILALAEESGIGNELGRWIIKQSLSGERAWQDAGYSNIKLSVNLSPEQLNTDPNLAAYIAETTKSLDLNPALTEYELTENATIEETERLRQTLIEIRDSGASISIDDFGMGHSSLSYLFDFFANVVKLDASLVQVVTAGEDRRLIVGAILNLCAKLNVGVIAEGVETKEQLEIISELGADYFQGWYFSKSLTIDNLIEYLKTHGTQ